MISEQFKDPGWAWEPYEPDLQHPWDLRLAGHLYRRAAFGASWAELQQAIHDGPQPTIDRLLRPKADVAEFQRTYDGYEASSSDPSSGSIEGLRQWWLRRMILSPWPLLEKMTLFWHSHFGVTNARVASARLMQAHVQRLRSHALGSYADLLKAALEDPAVLISLDARANRKAQPNDGLARALLHEYCLGPEGCSAKDVEETARALTGWFVFIKDLRWIEREFDEGSKTIFGQSGPWRAADAARIALAQPATARRLVRKLYAWLVSETDTPADRLLAPLADSFAKDYDVAKLVERMLRSRLFFSAAAYRQRVKSPVEFALGIVKGLEVLLPTGPLGRDLAAMGQNLGQPPTVKGWPGGRAWLNPFTLLARSNLAEAILSGTGSYASKIDPLAVAKKHGYADPKVVGQFWMDVMLQGDVDPRVTASLLECAQDNRAAAKGDPAAPWRRFAHLVVTLPEYQLA